jgi:hypothetical protein
VYARALHGLGVTAAGTVHRVPLSAFPARWDTQPGAFAASAFAAAEGGILLLDADADFELRPDTERDLVLSSLPAAAAGSPAVPLVLIGDAPALDGFLRDHAGLADLFAGHIEFPGYTPEELAELASRHLQRRGFEVTGEARTARAECFVGAPGITAWGAHRFAAYIGESAGSPLIGAADVLDGDNDEESAKEQPAVSALSLSSAEHDDR